MKFNCPICGKTGLPDYRREEVLCPSCDTDLKAYMLLHQTGKKQKNKLNVFVWTIPCLILIVSLLFIFFQESTFSNQLKQHNEEITLLNDSISSLLKITENIPQPAETVYDFVYTIRKGDSFCLISQKIFGTEKYAQSIAKKNQMDLSDCLIIGNTLRIPSQ